MKANSYMSIADNTFEPDNIIIENRQSKFQQQSGAIKIRYTIKQGDQKRLNRAGVLKVYYLDAPVEIPVIPLLGKWKKSHIGITFEKTDEEWKIERDYVPFRINTRPTFMEIVRRVLGKHKALYIREKAFG
jgi:hypothetical protein